MRWLALVALVCSCFGEPAIAVPALRPTALGSIEASHDLDGRVVGASAAPATLVISFASWCVHCHEELGVIASLRASHPQLRVLGVNYMGHEVYQGRGNARAVRTYVAARAPWLRVVPIDDALFEILGRPPRVPTVFVFDRAGALVAHFDRVPPTGDQLDELLRDLGA